MASKISRPVILKDAVCFHKAVTRLCDQEVVFAQVVEQWGEPPMWFRPPGFVSLLHMILEQQVSLASAQAVMDKLRARTTRITPAMFLLLSNQQLKNMGFSRQKTTYAQGLAQAIIEQKLPLRSMSKWPPEKVYQSLLKLRGIGPWTANVYLMMSLRHADIWPSGDLALRLAMRELFDQSLKRLEKRCTGLSEDEIQFEFSARWQPLRSVATRLCWLHYLRVRNR